MIKKALGIDISDHTIEFAVLAEIDGSIKALRTIRTAIGPKIVERGLIVNAAELETIIRKLITEIGHDLDGRVKMIFGLPTSQVYFHHFEVARPDMPKLDAIVQQAAKETFPLEEGSVVLTYRTIASVDGSDEVRVLLAAVKRDTISGWQDLFTKLCLPVVTFDFEPLALYRGIYRERPSQTVCLIDVGAFTTDISIFSRTGLSFSYTLRYAGNDLTEEIARELRINPAEAEKLKIAYGVGKGTRDRQEAVRNILSAALGFMVKEIKINLDYFENKYATTVNELVLVGGSSLLPGLKDYLDQANLKWPVKFGQPLIGHANTALEFIEAVGLARRGLEADQWDKTDPVIGNLPIGDSKNKEKVIIFFPPAVKIIVGNFKKRPALALSYLAVSIIFILLVAIILGFIKRPVLLGEFKFFSASKIDKINSPEIPIGEENNSQSAAAPAVKTDRIKIKNLASGINIRSGPGTEYSVIGHAPPLAEYELSAEVKDWYQISTESDSKGWVSKKYAEEAR